MAILSSSSNLQGILSKPPQNVIGIEDLHRAFSGAETEAFKDPWIRTTANKTKGGSTAYGPVQLTGSLVRNYMLNKPEVIQDKDFANRYLQQSALFNKHGNNEGKITSFDPSYDYGGSGSLNDESGQEGYSRLSRDIMSDLWRTAKTKKNPLNTMIKYWRWGEGSDKTKKDDPEYFRRFYKHMEKK